MDLNLSCLILSQINIVQGSKLSLDLDLSFFPDHGGLLGFLRVIVKDSSILYGSCVLGLRQIDRTLEEAFSALALPVLTLVVVAPSGVAVFTGDVDDHHWLLDLLNFLDNCDRSVFEARCTHSIVNRTEPLVHFLLRLCAKMPLVVLRVINCETIVLEVGMVSAHDVIN